MSWLSLCLDSADRQISWEMRVMAFARVAAIAPICQSHGMRAGRPTVLQIMSVLVSSPLLLFIPISSSCSVQWAVLCSEREKWNISRFFTYSDAKFPARNTPIVNIWKGIFLQCIMFSIRSEALSVQVFRHLGSSHCHPNKSIIICTIFLVTEAN